MTTASRVTRRMRAVPLALGASVAVAGAAYGVYFETLKPAPLETILPESTAAVFSTDARWAWDAAADLRATPQFQQMEKGLAHEMHLNLETDVTPWAGQVAGAVLTSDFHHPAGAFLIEVRNPVEYYKVSNRLRRRLESQASKQWKQSVYNGVDLSTTHMGVGPTRVSITTAWLRGWVLVGVGDGSAKRIIDSWQGRKPSLATNAAWGQALAKLPEHRMTWGGANTGALTNALKSMGAPIPSMDSSRMVMAGAVTDMDDGFRAVSSAVAIGPTAKKFLHDVADNLPAISPSLAGRLPDGTIAAFTISDPAAFWRAYKPLLKSAFGSAQVKQKLDQVMAIGTPLESAIGRCHGGLALAVAYTPDHGFGVVAMGDTGEAPQAQASSDDLATFVGNVHGKFERHADASYTIETGANVPGGGSKMFRVAPTWQAQDRYLVFATNPDWLVSGTGDGITPLPDEAQGAQMAMQGNFRFVQPLLTSMKGDAPASNKAQPAGLSDIGSAVSSGWGMSKLADAHWDMWSAIHSDGTVDGVMELRSWPWRDALRDVAKTISDHADH